MIIYERLFEQTYGETKYDYIGEHRYPICPIKRPKLNYADDLRRDIKLLKWSKSSMEDEEGREFYLNELKMPLEDYEFGLEKTEKELAEKEKQYKEIWAENDRKMDEYRKAVAEWKESIKAEEEEYAKQKEKEKWEKIDWIQRGGPMGAI